MNDRPIIFSAPMVRALLDGRKTMTRRLAWRLVDVNDNHTSLPTPWQKIAPDDRLWVRESLTHVTSDPVSARPCSVHCYTASIPVGMDSANPYEPNYLFPGDGEPNLKPKSIPSIHMPRWCSRLTLNVTATKIERLQDISNADAVAEGAKRFDDIPCAHPFPASAARWSMESPLNTDHCLGDARMAFANLWIKLHGAASWDENPEVVALSFTVHKHNIDALPKAAWH